MKACGNRIAALCRREETVSHERMPPPRKPFGDEPAVSPRRLLPATVTALSPGTTSGVTFLDPALAPCAVTMHAEAMHDAVRAPKSGNQVDSAGAAAMGVEPAAR